MGIQTADVEALSRNKAITSILEVICRTTGMGFAAVARVTQDRWTAYAVRDEINFGLVPGGELQVETTICNEIRVHEAMVIIDHVAEDKVYCNHPTPALYGFQSYISVPIFDRSGKFFGTLCAIDPCPAKVDRPEIVQMFRLFADLITHQMNAAADEFSRQLADCLRQAKLPDEIIADACQLLGRRLSVSRVVYGEVDESGTCVFMRRDWTADGVMSVAGFTKVMNDFGPELIAALNAGQVVANEDVARHPFTARYAEAYATIGVRAEVLMPLVKDGVLRLVLAFHRNHPYQWSSEELDYARSMAEQTWVAVDAVRAQAELRSERDRSQYVFDSMAEGFAVLDRNWTVLRMNAEGLRLTQRSASEVIGRNHWDIWPETRGTEFEAICRVVMETAKPEIIEVSHVLPSSKHVWIETRAYPSSDGGIAFFFRDITERKVAEEALREADRRKDEFLAMLAHELRNPLAPIGAAAELLQIMKLDEKRVRQTSQVINRQVRHMTALVDDLLDVSRLTRGLVELDNTPLDIRHVVADAVEQITPMIQTRRHHLALHLPPDITIVNGDKKRLIQVVTNILNNAAKYTPEGGQIVLQVDAHANHVTIEVQDNGIGMEPELAARAFDLFAQAARTSDRSAGGLGLGLALVKSLTELHGGRVSCASAGLGKGSTFSVQLPRRVESTNQNDLKNTDDNVPQQTDPLRILVVDDNEDAASMLAMVLEASGHQVTVEYSSSNALKRAKQIAPHVCVLDIGLPEMDGIELAKTLRARPETARSLLIAVTGYGQDQDRKQTQAAGFDHHLVKPADIKQLIAMIAQVKNG
jgi:PAS domain S-box-containing protein